MEKLEIPKSDRRSGVDRRCFNYTNHVPERRSGEERRESKTDKRRDFEYMLKQLVLGT